MATMGPVMPPQPPGGQAGPPPEEQGPGIGGGNPAQPAQMNPKMEQALMSIKEIVKHVRTLGINFPTAVMEVRQINDAVQRLSGKIQQSGPAPEPMSPPV